MKKQVSTTAFFVALSLLALNAQAQNDGFKKTETGLEYKIVKHGNSNVTPKPGDHLEVYAHVMIGDSTFFDSRKIYEGKPVPFQIQAPKYKGDFSEGIMMMHVGDSAVFRYSIDSLKKQGQMTPPSAKPGDMITQEIVLVSVKSEEEMKKETQEKAALQKEKDEKLLQEYFKKNHIEPTKTASGMYYRVTSHGTGPKPEKGQTVSMKYKGMLLDGSVFDTNMDSSKGHPQPFDFPLGQGRVIKGWDEGIALLNKGDKATLYIPSGLAYGERAMGAAIPANSVMIFDVEVLDIKPAAATPQRPPMQIQQRAPKKGSGPAAQKTQN